jgi:hypothetical protein
MPFEFLLLFFLCVSSFYWQATFTSLALPPSFLSLLIILLLNRLLLWVYLFSPTCTMVGPFSTCPLIFSPLGFCCLPIDIRVLGAFFSSMSFFSSFLQDAIDEDVRHANMHSRVGEHS